MSEHETAALIPAEQALERVPRHQPVKCWAERAGQRPGEEPAYSHQQQE